MLYQSQHFYSAYVFLVPLPWELEYSSNFNTASAVFNKNHTHIMNLQRGWVSIY